jgi:hypothetical protein
MFREAYKPSVSTIAQRHQSPIRSWRKTFWIFSAAFFLLARPASAVLGGDAASVQSDQVRMQATLRVTQSQGYAVHEMRTLPGNVVREYVSPEGKVFGVAWQGPFRPDFQQLLGSYFQQFSQAGQKHRRGSGPLMIEQPGLVLHSGGHMRAFFGKAYVPDMLPQGVTADAIQ